MSNLIDEITDYVLKTPENTNYQILRPMLERLGNSGNNSLVVNLIWDEEDERIRTDKTAREIEAVLTNGGTVIIHEIQTEYDGNAHYVTNAYYTKIVFNIYSTEEEPDVVHYNMCWKNEGYDWFKADSPDEYFFEL